MKYNISKTITGIVIRYECPNCQISLRSSLNEAGNNDVCPECQTGFVVPGSKEREQYQAQQSERLRKKEEAKEKKRLEQEREKQNKIEKKQRELASAKQQKQEQLALKKESERHRQLALAGANFDPSNHDWSTGAPYVYDCVEMGTVSKKWQQFLSDVINRKAGEGWEYFRSESLLASRPNGCFAALFGSATTEFNVVVLVFRKPTPVRSKKDRSTLNCVRGHDMGKRLAPSIRNNQK